MDLSLKGKRVVITGGSKGIGKEIALTFAKEGADVCVCYRTDDGTINETIELLKKAGSENPSCVKGDVSDESFAKEVAAFMKETYGGVDILVNNAGINDDGLLMRMKAESFQKVLNTNLSGAFYMTKELSTIMLKQREGHIVNISSVAGVKGNAGQANYSASKAGLIGLTMSAAKELGSKGITVNAVAPGLIDTAMMEALSEEKQSQILSSITVGRVGTPEDVANLVCFLSSDKAAYITGQVIVIDGGLIM
jgi:3-oxoacyl-(acyl-carrier-protein) reductase